MRSCSSNPATSCRGHHAANSAALALESSDECNDGGIVAERRRLGAELREHPTGLALPFDVEGAGPGFHEHDPHQVAVIGRERLELRVEAGLRAVPREHVPARPEHVGRAGLEGMEQRDDSDRRPVASGGERPTQRMPGEQHEMITLDRVEPQGASEAVDHLDRCVDRSALFEPRVPTDRDAGEHRHLLAAQPFGPPAAPRREPDIGRLHGMPAFAEELGEIGATSVRHTSVRSTPSRRAVRGTRTPRIGPPLPPVGRGWLAPRMEHLLSRRARSARSSVIRDLLKLIDQPGMLSLAGGLPAAECLAAGRIRQAAAATLDVAGPLGVRALQYGPTEGDASLRATVGERVGAPADRVLVTAGSQQALDLVARAVLDPGDVVVVEQPGYLGAIQALRGV